MILTLVIFFVLLLAAVLWNGRPAQRRAEARALLTELVNGQDPEIYSQIRNIAKIMASRLMIEWLNSRRIAHCAHCPNTDQLRKRDDKWFCKQHFEVVEIDLTKNAKLKEFVTAAKTGNPGKKPVELAAL